MLKHDIKNGFRQSTRTLSIFFQLNTTHADLVIKNYFWIKHLISVSNMELSRINKFALLEKFVKYTKLFKIQGTVC